MTGLNLSIMLRGVLIANFAFKIRARTLLNTLSRSKTTNIAYVVNSFDKGGLEQVVLNLAKGLQYRNTKTWIFVVNNEVGDLARYLPNPRSIIILNNSRYELLRYLSKYKIDLLHYHYCHFRSGLAHKLGIKTIYTIHNAYTWLKDIDFVARAERLKRMDVLVAVSEWVRNYYCVRSTTLNTNVQVIPNGIDTIELYQSDALEPSLYGLTTHDFVFASIASFHRVKNHQIMISAMEALVDQYPNFKLLFVGNIGDEAYYNEISSRLSQSKAWANIIIVPYQTRRQIGGLLRNLIHCSILPSLQEGCSNTVLESLYLEVPQILSEVGNANELISKYPIGILIPNAYPNILSLTPEIITELSKEQRPDNLDALINAMEAMYINYQDYKKAASLAAKHSASQFTLDAMCEKYSKTIEDL